MSKHGSLWTRTEHAGTLYVVALLREELGRRIKTARLAAGLTQQELAARIGLRHAQDVSRYERGKTEVPSGRLDLIAEATGRRRSYFTRDPAEPEPADPGQEARLEGLIGEALAEIRALRKAVEALSGEG